VRKPIFAAALAAACLVASAPAVAQEHWTEGPVWSCSYFFVSTENWDKYMLYLRRNTLPLQTAQKQAGLILDYRTYIKDASGADDWNFAACTVHKSYGAALDFDAAEDARLKAISATHWKTQDENAQRTAAAERFALRTLVGSQTFRQINFRPMP
jgi:hypothetical protein